MKTKSAALRALLAAVQLLWLPAEAQVYNYAPVLDQSQTDSNSGAYVQDSISMAQTFVPSISGTFAELDLHLSNHNTGEGQPLIISIADTQNGVPNQILGTVSLSNVGGNWADYAISFSGLNISLTANSLYAFVLSCPGTFYGIYPGGTTYDSYSRGMSLMQNGTGAPWQTYSRALDLTFQTWMIPAPVPEPSGCVLLGAGVSISALIRRRIRAAR